MKNKHKKILGWFLLLFCCCGCAHLSTPSGTEMANQWIRKGEAFEKEGDLVAARNQFKIALTMDPQNQAAQKKQEQIRAELVRLAESHVRRGQKLDRQGKYARAREAFLTALRLHPDDPETLNLLTGQKRIQAEEFVAHVIRPGESLSKVAQLYYGDRKQFSIIARYNQMDDATTIRVGQTIKIPQVKELPLLSGSASLVSEQQEQLSKTEGEDGIDQVAIYRDHGIDLFNQKEYQEALVEFEKVLGARPDDKKAIDYSFQSRYQISKALFDEKQYLQAMEGFQSCLKLKQDCQKCHGYVRQSEDAYKDMHYRKGMAFFDQQLLAEAIREWNLVRERDPGYKRVQYLIHKAEKIRNKLDELKKKQ